MLPFFCVRACDLPTTCHVTGSRDAFVGYSLGKEWWTSQGVRHREANNVTVMWLVAMFVTRSRAGACRALARSLRTRKWKLAHCDVHVCSVAAVVVWW